MSLETLYSCIHLLNFLRPISTFRPLYITNFQIHLFTLTLRTHTIFTILILPFLHYTHIPYLVLLIHYTLHISKSTSLPNRYTLIVMLIPKFMFQLYSFFLYRILKFITNKHLSFKTTSKYKHILPISIHLNINISNLLHLIQLLHLVHISKTTCQVV